MTLNRDHTNCENLVYFEANCAEWTAVRPISSGKDVDIEILVFGDLQERPAYAFREMIVKLNR